MAFAVHLTGASQAALDALGKTIEARMKYLGETVSASCHAILGQTLRSVRAMTKVAKPGRVKVALKRRGDLRFSWWTEGGRRKMCLRTAGGVRLADETNGKPRFSVPKGTRPDRVQVYEFDDAHDGKTDVYLVAATSKGAANAWAKGVARRRVMRYAGLARRAVGVLMVKSNTKAPIDAVSKRIDRVAYQATRTTETVVKTAGGGVYTLTALDNLRYAKKAVKGGDAAIDLAIRKAVNKCVGLITHRFSTKDFFRPGDLPPVFADIKQRKSA